MQLSGASLVMFVLCLSTCLVRADEAEQVLEYLDRLGLDDLQTLHLETALETPLEQKRRQEWTKRLADLYVQRLMQVQGDQQVSMTILRKIEELLRRFPEADSAALQVMLLQADYNRAESLVTQWIADPTQTATRDQAGEILERVAPKLDQYRKQLIDEVELLGDSVDNLPEGKQRETRETELARQEAVLGRATYFNGWASYYLGLTGTADSESLYSRARESFRELLNIGETAYDELDGDWLGLESSYRCRALIGLALAESALGNVAASETCCRLLKHASVPPELQDQAEYWFVQGLLNAARYETAAEYAQTYIAQFNGKASQGKFSLCVSLVRAGLSADAQQHPERYALGLLGLQGLARLGRHAEIRQLVEQYQVPLADAETFLLRWIAGQRLLARAAETGQAEDYRAAARELATALDASDASDQLSSAAHCRFELAWCEYQLGEYEAAAQHFEQTVTGLKGSDKARAAQAAWSAFVAYRKLIGERPRFRTAALDVLRALQRDFPSDPLARKAESQIRRLMAEGQPPAETIVQLRKIPTDDATFPDSQYEICLLAHHIWSEAAEDQRHSAAQQVLDSTDSFLNIDRARVRTEQVLRCHLIAAEVLIGGDKPTAGELRQAAEHLGQSEPLTQRLPDNHALAADYHYRRLQWSGKNGDDAGRREHAEWLLKHAAGSVYELPALVVMARYIDRDVQRAAPERAEMLIGPAHDIYHRLAEKLGTSPEILQSRKNARVTLSRLAEYAFRMQRYGEASQHLERLLAAFPKDRDYLRRAGLALVEAGSFERSLAHWRTLLAGSQPGTDGWIEAKYYQLACLGHVDPAQGRKVTTQFQLLYPDLGGPPWKQRFQELEQ